MLLSLLKIALATILVVQEKQVKGNTPRLPEAGRPRKGVRGDRGKQIRLLILGDSAAAGVGVDHPSGEKRFQTGSFPTPLRMIDKPFTTVIPFVPLVQYALVDWGSR